MENKARSAVYVKEVLTAEGSTMTAYSTLTGALKSETLYHMYPSARYVIKSAGKSAGQFQYGGITISKVPLITQKYAIKKGKNTINKSN